MPKHGHPRFYELLDELAELHSRKNHDYSGDDPLANLKMTEAAGIAAWVGVVVRLTDKMSRLLSFAKKRTLLVQDEGIVDTLKDMAIYALLGIVLFEEREKREKNLFR